MTPEKQPDLPGARIVFDLKLPLWGLITALAIGAALGVTDAELNDLWTLGASL
ncbi:hypothetical protein HC248_01427 [Polaromonas vacuolata]|uniref:Uncharacterized protein n=1 Tax=Polaromonas vacuolata TaxID=37448 RepID=A0A6H2H8D6_9BURK|nr:hypothetical protein HC248_01427 [Polaromonas vacuolata]